jgi:hypothetical protein
MTAPLSVDPAAVRAASAAQAHLASTVAGLDVGGAMAAAAEGVANLSSGAACRFAGESFAAQAQHVADDMSGYATHLAAAASTYERADEQLGDRLGETFR